MVPERKEKRGGALTPQKREARKLRHYSSRLSKNSLYKTARISSSASPSALASYSFASLSELGSYGTIASPFVVVEWVSFPRKGVTH